ncbi:D-alanyl-D-alanine carboxypeptidase family protein [Streptomyces palmae]|nr:D-alanyl-D-alanine carboxypeptidase [Streptomyces palmae]
MDSATPAPRSLLRVMPAGTLALATALLLGAAPAQAAGPRSDKDPKPPARMSTVGGDRLGRPGTQVDPGPGTPDLPKGLSGRSWLVADADSGKVLAAHNAHWRLPPASTMKMLFADTVLPRFPKTRIHKVDPSDLLGIGEGSSMVGIKENLTYSVHDLWLGVFLRSGNDAVHVLAAMNGGVPKTVRDMQARARQLNALDTHVVTPDGYDERGQVSSAYDLTLFARAGLRRADFREYCSTAYAEFPGDYKKDDDRKRKAKGDESVPEREHFGIQNTNRLLTGYGVPPYKGIAGVKNGNTTNAGATFTGVAERGGRTLLVTVMNPSRQELNEVYKETAKLFDWGFAAAGSTRPVGTLVDPAPKGSGRAGKNNAPGAARHSGSAGRSGAQAASSDASDSDSLGTWTVVGIAAGAVALLGAAGGAVLLRRRRAMR